MVALEDLEVSDVIQTLRGVVARTDINAMYNPQGTVENNLTYQIIFATMRFQVMSIHGTTV